MSKLITIPADVKFINVGTKEETGVTLSFRSFLCDDVSVHPLWGLSLNETRAFRDILDALDKAEDGVMAVSEVAYPLLRKAIENPQYRTIMNGQEAVMTGYRRWNGAGMVQLLPFIDAIVDAKSDTANGAKEVKGSQKVKGKSSVEASA